VNANRQARRGNSKVIRNNGLRTGGILKRTQVAACATFKQGFMQTMNQQPSKPVATG
jgi:hypothetical protein